MLQVKKNYNISPLTHRPSKILAWEDTTASISRLDHGGHHAQALSAQIIPTSYRMAVSSENIDFWKPGIDRDHDSITQQNLGFGSTKIRNAHPSM